MAKRVIEDINQSSELEVSWVRRGSNPMSKVFLKKSADDPLQTENFDMLKSVAVAALLAHPTTAAFVKSFTEDAQLDAHLAKDEAGQTAAIAEFAKAKNMPMPEDDDGKKAATKKADDDAAALKKKEDDDAAAALAKGATDPVAAAVAKALENSPILKALQDENADLKKQIVGLADSSSTISLEKRAETEFRGVGIAKAEMVAVLKGLDTLDEPVRKSIEGVFKAFSELAARVGRPVGLVNLSKREDSATSELNKKAEAIAKSDNIEFAVALVKVCEDPANAELVEKADAEEAEARSVA